MGTDEIREKYLDFFKKKGHIEITPSPLVIDSDPTTLFTSSGMQQLAPYLKGEKHDIQPSIRMQDLDEVADNRHFSFFEMLGNWSLGDYFKKDQLGFVWEFYTKELGLPPEKLYVSVFGGGGGVPKDTESFEIWKKIGVSESHIHFYDAEKNWWSRAGTPDQMPPGEIGGPDSKLGFYAVPKN
ncbi:MAG: Alanine-tRNA ligase [Candidatus Woesebacteria bacterium GW2011_GWA1_40_43]|uniref:alanine--tRNA ligase n=1 Tax=Candidatus Woesebacteria bacterium GW2011_GWA1_40_43 TaxID=1618553 RepID=A0A0G0SB92_9BACT|nr:MAG: Alanine-tRNA ligase [Candidatus Woesebacteria bacterium GW2011_GWA1_40_43]